jgi:hypothetical protein
MKTEPAPNVEPSGPVTRMCPATGNPPQARGRAGPAIRAASGAAPPIECLLGGCVQEGRVAQGLQPALAAEGAMELPPRRIPLDAMFLPSGMRCGVGHNAS